MAFVIGVIRYNHTNEPPSLSFGEAKKTMKEYNHKEIEAKWQKHWSKKGIYTSKENPKQPKSYVLDMFPYPSGEGLHVGHPKGYIATDIYSRFKKMNGHNVLHPMGWDAFGLPAENYAIKTKTHPRDAVEKNIARYKEQLSGIGFNYDWKREINTTDPEYYRWTQWIFLQMYKKGLAFQSNDPINWCPSCQTGLANEDLDDGKCERCGSAVEKRPMRQWVLKITDYADRLLTDLDSLNWPESIKESQRNWIGRSEGMLFTSPVKDMNFSIQTFSSHFEAFAADTFVVIAPDHPLLEKLLEGVQNKNEILAFANSLVEKRASRGFAEEKESEGIFTGRYVVDPVGNGDLPIWIASYALANYGTGIVKCSAHDERDIAFAKKYNIKLREVVEPLVTRVVGEDSFKKGEPISERRAVVAVIKHWSEEKYLAVEWKKTGWRGFVIGGIENGEDAIKAGLREITEETGYKNVEFVKTLGGIIHAQFYQAVKKQNRLAHFEPVLFKLKNGDAVETNEEEKALHAFKWLTPEEFENFITHEDMKIIWKRVQGNYFFTGKNYHASGCDITGVLTEPTMFSGRQFDTVRHDIAKYLEENKLASRKITYRLKDWVFSRQRYWGEPIPLIHCEKCGVVPVPEKDLPVKLPDVKNYAPTGTGESPLAAIEKWVNVKCPTCKSKAKRETNTMPQWAGSCWYYLRYMDPKNKKKLVDPKKEKYWAPVDVYVGGAEHATRHLIYARFWHKFLFDIGVVSTIEPFTRLYNVGLILAEDGRKMSKRYGNVINPDDVVATYGADTFRIYEMFMGPFTQASAWDTKSIMGSRRFIERIWRLAEKISAKAPSSDKKFETLLHSTIKKVTQDIETFSFNTAISSLMILSRELEEKTEIAMSDFMAFLQLLAPFAPHIADELWTTLGGKKSVHVSSWPTFDEAKIVTDTVTIVVQINGKVRDEFEITSETTEEQVKDLALSRDNTKKWLNGANPKKIIYIKNKLVSIVIEQK